MIDQRARNRMAELVRHLVAGLITNDEFEDRLPASSDPAIHELFYLGVWTLYSDLSDYRLTGADAIGGEERHEVARYILFLKAGLEYRWPLYPGMTWRQAFADFVTFGSV